MMQLDKLSNTLNYLMLRGERRHWFMQHLIVTAAEEYEHFDESGLHEQAITEHLLGVFAEDAVKQLLHLNSLMWIQLEMGLEMDGLPQKRFHIEKVHERRYVG
ncbi:hypothetical protein D3C84_836450 [compost metagenome]